MIGNAFTSPEIPPRFESALINLSNLVLGPLRVLGSGASVGVSRGIVLGVSRPGDLPCMCLFCGSEGGKYINLGPLSVWSG